MHIVLEYSIYVALIFVVATLLFASCAAFLMVRAGAMELARVARRLRLLSFPRRRNRGDIRGDPALVTAK